MAGQAQSWGPEPRERTFDMPSLRRLAIWGGLATASLLIAVIATYTDAGARRLAAANAQKAAATTPQLQSRLPELDALTQRLVGAVESMAADRERLVARIGTIERNLDDITGALKRQAVGAASATAPPQAPAGPPTAVTPPAAAPAPAPAKESAKELPAAPEPPAATATARPPGPPLSLVPTPALVPAPAPPAPAPERLANAPAVMAADTPDPAKTDFGVDVGGAVNFDGLRALWGMTKGNNPALLEGLYPLVVVRENSRTKAAELRLVVGPLGNVEAATHLCAALSAARRYCQPVSFEGQRLAEADSVPEHKPAAAPKPKPAPPPPVSNVPRLFR